MLPRIYPILDTATLHRLALDPLLAAQSFLEGGAGVLQFRHKDAWTRETFALARSISLLCREAGAQFLVNDRADCALLLGAGLHLGQDDLPPADARIVLGPAALLGFSTHSPAQMSAADAEPVDYVAFGPVFPTASKIDPDPNVGIEGLRAVRALTASPLVAIGGITRDNAYLCWDAGADSVAVIGDLFPSPCTPQTLRERMTEWYTLADRYDGALIS